MGHYSVLSQTPWEGILICDPSSQFGEIGKGKEVTSYPAFKDALEGYYKYSNERVVVDGNLVTSQGPGTCFDFSLKIVELLLDRDTADTIKKALLV